MDIPAAYILNDTQEETPKQSRQQLNLPTIPEDNIKEKKEKKKESDSTVDFTIDITIDFTIN